MKVKDIAEKYLLSYNDVFADIVNGAIFGGEEIVKSDELADANLITQFKDDSNMHHEQVRDIAKFWKKNEIIFSFIGIENQSVPDKDIRHPEELLDLLDILAGDKRFKELKGKVKDIRKEGRIINMCELLDEIENRGIEKGIEQGIEKGRSEGEESATLRIAKKFKDSNVAIDIIMKATGLTKEEIKEL